MKPHSDLEDPAFYRALLDNLHDGVYFVDRERRITYWNKGAERITGYRREEVLGYSCKDNILVHTTPEGCMLCLEGCPLTGTLQDGEPREAEVFLKHKNGHRVPVRIRVTAIRNQEGAIVGGVEVFSDNSSKIAAVQMAKHMEMLAYFDPLTETGNRRYAEMKLAEALAKFEQFQWPMGLLFIDLDHFKQINDAHGHDAGDAALRMTAATIGNNLRSFDFLGRWGGEEFVAVLSSAGGAQTLGIAERCRRLVEQSAMEWNGSLIQVTVSIGATSARPGDTVESLMARADRLLYQSKRGGRNRITSDCEPA